MDVKDFIKVDSGKRVGKQNRVCFLNPMKYGGGSFIGTYGGYGTLHVKDTFRNKTWKLPIYSLLALYNATCISDDIARALPQEVALLRELKGRLDQGIIEGKCISILQSMLVNACAQLEKLPLCGLVGELLCYMTIGTERLDVHAQLPFPLRMVEERNANLTYEDLQGWFSRGLSEEECYQKVPFSPENYDRYFVTKKALLSGLLPEAYFIMYGTCREAEVGTADLCDF